MGIAFLILLAIAVAIYLLFEKSGHWLVADDNVQHVKWIAVLDGQSADLERIDYAADLVKQGVADSVLLLGRRVYRDRSNTEFYAEDFMKLGDFDSNAVFLVPHNDPSTISEAYSLIPWLKKHNADTVLLVTGAASTYRVKRIFQKLSGKSPVYLTQDIHHISYNPKNWYNNRESRKDWLRGWAALFASYIDLFNTDTLEASDSSYYRPIRSYAEYRRDIRSNVNFQKLLPKIEDKIKSESAKEAVKDGAKESAKDGSKEAIKDSTNTAKEKASEQKESAKAPAKDAPKAPAKEQAKAPAKEQAKAPAKEQAKTPAKAPAKPANNKK